MALSLVKSIATSTAAGVLDIATEYVDQSSGLSKPFENVSDWVRTLATVGGYGIGYWKEGSSMGDYATTLAVAYEPLLLRTVYKLVMGKTPLGSIRMVRSGQGYGPIMPPPSAPPPEYFGAAGYRPFVPA